MWAAGHAAFDLPVKQLATDLQLRWTERAEAIFWAHFSSSQFPEEGCAERASKFGYIAADADMHWGMGSTMRDVSNLLLFGLFAGKTVVWNPESFIDPGGDFGECARGQFWAEACYFQPFSGCQKAYESGLMGGPSMLLPSTGRETDWVNTDSQWFLTRSQAMWEQMVNEGAVNFHNCNGRVVSDPLEVRQALQYAGPAFEHAQRLSMFRAILLQVAFRPNDALGSRIQQLVDGANLSALQERGQMVAMHVRRTDKAADFRGKAVPTRLLDQDAENTVKMGFRRLVQWLEKRAGPMASYFLMSDDPRTFRQGVYDVLGRYYRNPDVAHANSEFMSTGEVSKLDAKALKAGHETWSHRRDLYMNVLAEALAVGKHASYILGCGTAGISQLVAQLIGGRLRIDPNLVSLWEDDDTVTQYIRQHLTDVDFDADDAPLERAQVPFDSLGSVLFTGVFTRIHDL